VTTTQADNLTNPPADLTTQIRQAIHTAHRDGRPTPGRPTLVRLTGATDHAVKTTLHQLAAERPRDHQTTTPPHHEGPRCRSTGVPGCWGTSPLPDREVGFLCPRLP
jgi:hypothetical protein